MCRALGHQKVSLARGSAEAGRLPACSPAAGQPGCQDLARVPEKWGQNARLHLGARLHPQERHPLRSGVLPPTPREYPEPTVCLDAGAPATRRRHRHHRPSGTGGRGPLQKGGGGATPRSHWAHTLPASPRPRPPTGGAGARPGEPSTQAAKTAGLCARQNRLTFSPDESKRVSTFLNPTLNTRALRTLAHCEVSTF